MNGVGMRATLAVCGASLQFSLPTISAAQQPRALTPVQVVEGYLAANDSENWKEAAQYLDVSTIERMRRDLLRTANDTTNRPHLTPEEIMKYQPEMPRVVAEYQVKQAERAWISFDPIRYEFADVKDRGALTRLTADELAISWVKAHSIRYKLGLSRSMSSAQCSAIPSSFVPKLPHSILGDVIQGMHAYVLVAPYPSVQGRTERDSIIEGPPDVYELRYVGGQWKLLPPMTNSFVGVSCAMMETPESKAKK